MPLILGKDGVNRELKEVYLGVGGINKQVKELYLGKGGVNKQIYRASTDINIPLINFSAPAYAFSKISTGMVTPFNTATFDFNLTQPSARTFAIAELALYFDPAMTKCLTFGKGRNYDIDEYDNSTYYYVHSFGWGNTSAPFLDAKAYGGQLSGLLAKSSFTVTKGSTGIDINVIHDYYGETYSYTIPYTTLATFPVDTTNVYGYGLRQQAYDTTANITNLIVK